MARTADPLSYALVVMLYSLGIPSGVLRPDDHRMREIEGALQIAERSCDDLALAFTQMALGVALAHRQTDADRDHGHELLAEVGDMFLRLRDVLLDLQFINVYVARERAGVETAMPPSRLCAPPSTICSPGDNGWHWAFLRRVFWCRHCSIAGPRVTWPKPRPRSSG